MNAARPAHKQFLRCPQLYRSTWVFLGLLAVILFLANVPGQVLEEPSLDVDGSYVPDFELRTHYVHGWPLRALRRGPYYSWNGLPSPWNLTQNVELFNPLAVVVNTVVAISVIVAGGVVFQVWRKRRGSLRQFHLVEMLAVVALVAIGLKSLVRQRAAARADRSAVQAMQSGAVEGYPFEVWQPWGPTWLRSLVGESGFSEFDRVISIYLQPKDIPKALALEQLLEMTLDGPASNADLEILEGLPNLRTLTLIWTSWEFLESETEVDLEEGEAGVASPLKIPRLRHLLGLNLYGTESRGGGLENVPQLEVLDVGNSRVTVEALAEIGKMSSLRFLRLESTPATTETTAIISKLSCLQELRLGGPLIDDDSIRSLIKLRHLRYLDLANAQITDASIASLLQMTQLQSLSFAYGAVTPDGKASLRAALPRCKVY